MPRDVRWPAGFRDQVLRSVLGDRLDSLEPEQAEELATEFRRGGAAAVLALVGTANQAAASLVHARRLSRQARERLASQSTAMSRSWFAAPEWQATIRVIDAHLTTLVQRKEVVGVGPGFRRRNGVRVDELCAVVYVNRKRSQAALRRAKKRLIPAALTAPGGVTVGTDVVELGRLRRQAAAGGSVGPSGRKRRGTIGLFASDLAHGGNVAITAMHVFGNIAPSQKTACVSPAHGLAGSASFGSFRRGTMARTDAAVVSLGPGLSPDNTLPELGPIRGVRPISLPGDYDRAVRLRGAETGRVVSGTIVEPLVHLPDDDLEAAILVDIHSVEGDSGAALIDASGLVLGFLVGVIGPKSSLLRVFTPALLTLQLLSCDFPPNEN